MTQLTLDEGLLQLERLIHRMGGIVEHMEGMYDDGSVEETDSPSADIPLFEEPNADSVVSRSVYGRSTDSRVTGALIGRQPRTQRG